MIYQTYIVTHNHHFPEHDPTVCDGQRDTLLCDGTEGHAGHPTVTRHTHTVWLTSQVIGHVHGDGGRGVV